ncbi:unnamed protein product [Linum trigynum]|uniref:Uncharacterized protein n=1 Tax=Linum trigynum TaxID=586398 RepID=A0AAV2DYQ6_9ROSI
MFSPNTQKQNSQPLTQTRRHPNLPPSRPVAASITLTQSSGVSQTRRHPEGEEFAARPGATLICRRQPDPRPDSPPPPRPVAATQTRRRQHLRPSPDPPHCRRG